MIISFINIFYTQFIKFARVDTHSSSAFKKKYREKEREREKISWDGDRKSQERKSENEVYQQATRSIWGEEYVQSRESSLSLGTCVHPCLSRQEYRLWRTSPRASVWTILDLRRVTRQKFHRNIKRNTRSERSIDKIYLMYIFLHIFLLIQWANFFIRNIFKILHSRGCRDIFEYTIR